MTNKFHIYKQPLRVEPEKAVLIVYSTLVIHNWLIKKKDPPYTVIESDDKDDEENALRSFTLNPNQDEIVDETHDSSKMRSDLTNFFNNEGERSWQWSKI